MKILYYNWMQFDDDKFYGGGVNTYQKNLIEELIKNEDHQVYFLSSGKAYDKHMKKTYIRQTQNIFGDQCKSFEIVNSPILSSAKLSFYDTKTYLEDEKIKQVFIEFVQEQNGFDVIHFNNFEGLTLKLLEAKVYFPKTRWIYTLHNYYLFCPEVQLWRGEHCNCTDFDNGKNCVYCGVQRIWKWKVQRSHYYKRCRDSAWIHWKIKILNQIERGAGWLTKNKISTKKRQEYADEFLKFRQQNIAMFNQYIDIFLCVSECVKNIAETMGLKQSKLFVEYIGTKFADITKYEKKAVDQKYFTIAYLGYMNNYKGFYFLLDALEKMRGMTAEQMNVVICAKNTDMEAVKQMNRLKSKFHNVVYKDGYTHEELELILQDVDLGVVPVLWEDNLPQVAIEMSAYGVPVLSSNLGGAKELSGNDAFVFEAGNIALFLDKLEYFNLHREKLFEYWKTYRKLLSMKEHRSRLMLYYKGNKDE